MSTKGVKTQPVKNISAVGQQETDTVSFEQYEAEMYLSMDAVNYKHRPEIMLLVNREPMLFLVD